MLYFTRTTGAGAPLKAQSAPSRPELGGLEPPAGGFRSNSEVRGAIRVQASNEDTTREMPASPNWLEQFLDEQLPYGEEQTGIAPEGAGAGTGGSRQTYD